MLRHSTTTCKQSAKICVEGKLQVVAKSSHSLLNNLGSDLQSMQQPPLDKRSVDEVLAAMDQVRWTSPIGSPSTTELL